MKLTQSIFALVATNGNYPERFITLSSIRFASKRRVVSTAAHSAFEPTRRRKGSLFHITVVGANIADLICSMLAICHEQGIDAQGYLIAAQQNQLRVEALPENWLP